MNSNEVRPAAQPKAGPAAALKQAHHLVAEQMRDVEATLRDLPDLHPPALREAVLSVVSAGGKRIRPMLTLLIAGMFNCLHDRRIVDLASAVEMLHTATLVHDDLIDGSLMRRGTQTLNAVWTPAATVLTGDYLFAYAANLAARTDSPKVMSIFADTLSVIVAGELQQQFTDFALRSNRDDYYRRIYSKTASMFVLATTACGVMCAANDDQMAALHDYGRDLGLVFQVMDDVLDFTSAQSHLGKPVGSDLRRGLITLPVICYTEAYGTADIECALRGECDPQRYDQIVERIRNSNAIALALREAESIANNARAVLNVFPPSAWRSALIDLVDYTLTRSY